MDYLAAKRVMRDICERSLAITKQAAEGEELAFNKVSDDKTRHIDEMKDFIEYLKENI